jgi:antirestriction protein ArdC
MAAGKPTERQPNIQFRQLLEEAVEKPGTLTQAYSAFWNYSTGNQILAFMQCRDREIPVGPISTYRGWQALGRQVRKGEKALSLCMPVTYKKTVKDDAGAEAEEVRQTFVHRRNWFVVSQTDGDDVPGDPAPGWDRDSALRTLGVEEIPFESPNGNCQGYATGHAIAINPVAAMPEKTTFHELAHVVLGHTEAVTLQDGDTLPRSLKEAEAEAVALICLESLGQPGAEFCRGYIQNWLSGAEIPERSAQRIFKAADRILKAGRTAQEAS